MNKYLLFSLIFSPLVHAQEVWTAGELDDLAAELVNRVQPNGMAVLPGIINEGSYMGHLLHREQGPGFAELHDIMSDIYFVTAGSATLVTGGSMMEISETGPGEFIAPGIEGGERRRVAEGDVVHIPPGLPHHLIVDAPEGLTYFIIKTSSLLPGERAVHISGIPGVITEGTRWRQVWADIHTADGIVGTADGGVMFAQEQTDTVKKLINGQELVLFENTNGGGSVSLDNDGRIFIAQRTCTEPMNPERAGCNEMTRIAQLAPEYRILAMQFADGSSLGRVNDLIADGRGGAFFTSGGAWHVNADGEISSVVDTDIRSNGIMLNRDGDVLYVTNNTEVLAFDIRRDGSTRNRRVFASLNGDNGGDGMAIDNDGRLYVTGNLGIHVISEKGDYLGMIPTPRRAITVAFSGPDKKTLFAPSMGAIGPDGKAWETPEGIRNTAMTIYTLDVETAGFGGRAK